jgi:hypothetical protein
MDINPFMHCRNLLWSPSNKARDGNLVDTKELLKDYKIIINIINIQHNNLRFWLRVCHCDTILCCIC